MYRACVATARESDARVRIAQRFRRMPTTEGVAAASVNPRNVKNMPEISQMAWPRNLSASSPKKRSIALYQRKVLNFIFFHGYIEKREWHRSSSGADVIKGRVW